MLEALETGLGLDIVLWLQANRSGLSDFFAVLLDQLGGDIGYLLLLPVVYWGISRRMGRELVYVLLIGMIGMVAMKELLMRPRPYMASDLITPLFTEDGYGLLGRYDPAHAARPCFPLQISPSYPTPSGCPHY